MPFAKDRAMSPPVPFGRTRREPGKLADHTKLLHDMAMRMWVPARHRKGLYRTIGGILYEPCTQDPDDGMGEVPLQATNKNL